LAFPPNYRQSRQDRERAKKKKAQEKQMRRDERNERRNSQPIEEREPVSNEKDGRESA
jgi:hypothetical protein